MENTLSKSVITFYRLPPTATQDGVETAWAAVVDPAQNTSMSHVIPLDAPPNRAASDVALWVGNPKSEFNYVIEDQVAAGANYLFVAPTVGAPVFGMPI